MDVAATSNYVRDLSRTLWFRTEDWRAWFAFEAGDEQGLVLVPPGRDADGRLAEAERGLATAGRPVTKGVVVSHEEGLVFCVADGDGGLLPALAGWVGRRVASVPALAALADAGQASLAAVPWDDAALAALDVAESTVRRDPSLWSGVDRTDAASVAAVLAERLPGERMWFWLSDEVPGDVPPLLVQPVASDPNRDRLDNLIRRLEEQGAEDGATGVCMVVDDGRIQFMGGGLHPAMLTALAGWVSQEVAAHPDLARLVGAYLVPVRGGTITERIERPALWDGIERPVAAGTLAAAVAALAAMQAGEACWCWMTAQAPDGAFMLLHPLDADPDGVRFRAMAATCHGRFPGSFRDAVSGILRRTEDGGLEMDVADEDVEAARSILAAAAAGLPDLATLAEASVGGAHPAAAR